MKSIPYTELHVATAEQDLSGHNHTEQRIRRRRMGVLGVCAALVLVVSCKRNDGGYWWPNPAPDPPEEISYTVADFVKERDAGDCPSGKRLKFEPIELIGPNVAGEYTMVQDGAADADDPKVLFTLSEEAFTGPEASTINRVVFDIGSTGCTLTIVSASG